MQLTSNGKTKMLVLRIEGKGNRMHGQSGDAYEAATAWGNLPCPQMDGINTEKARKQFSKKDWHCATINEEQFKLWWNPGQLKKLKRSHAVILDVPDHKVIKGGKQVIIDRYASRIVGKICPKELKPVWTKALKHSSTTEKERLFQSDKTVTQRLTQSKPSTPRLRDSKGKFTCMQKLMPSSSAEISTKLLESL